MHRAAALAGALMSLGVLGCGPSAPPVAPMKRGIPCPGCRYPGALKMSAAAQLQYLTDAPVGAEVFGILVTKEALLGVAAKLVVFLPTGVAILRRLLDKA